MSNQREQEALFAVRFSRCYRLLHFMACRVLGGTERVDEAIERCRLRSSLNPPQFEYEGAFRSWLLRVLIDEAVAVLRRSQQEAGGDDIGGSDGTRTAASCVTDRRSNSSTTPRIEAEVVLKTRTGDNFFLEIRLRFSAASSTKTSWPR